MATIKSLEVGGDLKVNGGIHNRVHNWHRITMLNGWTDYSGTYASALVRVIGSTLRIQGLVKGGSSSVIGMLPTSVPYPKKKSSYCAFNADSTVCRIIIEEDGRIYIHGAYSNGWVSIEGFVELD